jgi:Uma2 family endonuclease
MAMPALVHRYTVADVLAFPEDGKRYEVVHGELLVSPAPRLAHQAVLRELFRHLDAYLRPLGRGHQIFWSPADITYDEDTLVQPDLFVAHPHEISASWTTIKTLVLAVEVTSPSTARGDRRVKRHLYQECGVATYWVVDPDAQVVEVWHPGDDRPAIATDTLAWRYDDASPELTVFLTEIFAVAGGA